MDRDTHATERRRGHVESSRATAREALTAPPSRYLRPIALDEQTIDAVAVGVPDPIRAVIRSLIGQILDDVVLPTLTAETREELFRGLSQRLDKYQTTTASVVCLMNTTPAGVALMKRAERHALDLSALAKKIAGQKAADEVTFCEETYSSAIRILDRFAGLPKPTDPEEDQRHASKFNFAATLFSLAGCMITAVATEKSRPTPVATEVSFELLRLGAMDAYIAVRSALALRLPTESECDDALPMDDEDIALAHS